MNTSFFEHASQVITQARTQIIKNYSQEETEKFLAQAFTLATLQMVDSLTSTFPEEDKKTFSAYFESMTGESLPKSDLSDLLKKNSIDEEFLQKNFDDKFNAIVSQYVS